jgi:hypothetical protein
MFLNFLSQVLLLSQLVKLDFAAQSGPVLGEAFGARIALRPALAETTQFIYRGLLAVGFVLIAPLFVTATAKAAAE